MSVDNATVRNCTFVSNSAPYGSAIWVGEYGMQLYNSIFDTNYIQCSVPNEPGPTVIASCCDLYQSGGGGCHYFDIGTSGNFSLDPLFCDAANDNYTLKQSSPCAPGNHPQGSNCDLIGALPVGCAGVAIAPTTWGRIKAMFR